MIQQVYTDKEYYDFLSEIVTKNNIKNLLLVCDNAFDFLSIKEDIEKLKAICNIYKFNDISPNPVYESICKGIELFKQKKCTAILAIGGGSAIDVAKCIKLYSNMDENINYLNQEIIENEYPLIVIPTTAGTGSEATKYAVIYYKGEKQSITHESCIPQYVMLIPSLLETLPIYQKKSTMLDALCHSIESFWSVNSTDASRKLSAQAIRMILDNIDGYINNDKDSNASMLLAANTAGKAINITQTTAGHAMCYKVSSLFNISHGHAAALCLLHLWRFMLHNTDKVCDFRGQQFVIDIFGEIADCMGADTVEGAVDVFDNILNNLELIPNIKPTFEQIEILSNSVNATRLKNNPILLNKEDIKKIYLDIFKM